MVEVGSVSFKAIIDTSGIRGEVQRINALLARETVRLRVQLDTSAADKELNRIRQAVAQQAPARIAARAPVAAAATAAPQSGFARDFDSALQRQSKEAASLAREFDKTAAAAERAATQSARIQIRDQERQAAGLARELQKAAQVSFNRQQQEVAGFAREFDKAAAAQQRLQQQSARDQNILGGAKFSDKEIKNVEAALKRVNQETQKTDQVAALLRQKYGLADAEARKLAGTLGTVTQEQGKFNSAVAGLAAGAGFAAVQAGIQALQAAVAGIIDTFQKASSSYREFEKNILSFQAKSQGVEVDVEGLADEIDRVAKITSQSPASLSAAASNLVSLGVAATEVEGRLDGLAKASDVLGEDPVILGRVFQGALTAYEQYGVGIEEVSDIVSQAINTTAIGARSGAVELEQLFSKAAAPAATLGATLEELVTLDALFAGAGARPEARATAVETLLTRIASQKDKLEKEGVVIAVKENGGLDVEGTLRSLQARLEEIPDTAGRLSLLREFFGESAGNDILTAVTRLDASYADIQKNIDGANGAIKRSFDIVSQGTEFQAGVVTGGIEAAFNILGETLNPVEKGFIALQQAIQGNAEVDLSPLTEAAERLGVILGQNPELAEQLAESLSGLANAAVDQIVAVVDALSSLATNQDFIDATGTIAKGLETVIVLLGRFAQGVIGAFELIGPLFQEREIFPGVETSIAGLLAGAAPLKLLLGGLVAAFNEARDAVLGFADRFPFLVDTVINAIPGLRLAIEALQKLRGEAEEPIDPVEVKAGIVPGSNSKLVKGLKDFAAGLEKIVPEATDDVIVEPPTFNVRQEGLSAESGLKRFRDEQANLLREIEESNSEAQITLTQAGADPDAFLDQERKTLQDRVKVRQNFIAQIKELQKRPGISVAEGLALETALAEAEKELAGDRLAVAKNLQQDRQQVLDEIQRDNQQSVSELERQTAAAAAALAETPLSDRDRATAEAQAEQAALQQRIANRQQFLDELKKQEAQGGLSAEQTRALGDQIIGVETEIYGQRVQLAQSLEAERKRIVEQGFADQLTALSQFKQQEELLNQSQTSGLNDQGRLLEADTSVVSARNQLDQARLTTALAIAKAEADGATTTRGALAAQREIFAAQEAALEGQIEATAAEFASKRQSLTISEQLARIDAQRAIQAAEIAAIEADIAVRRAKATGATQQEIAGLQRIADLTASQIDSARNSAAVTDRVLAAKREELGLQEQLSAEQLKQNNLAETGNRLADARRGVIAALAAESNTSVEESLATIERVEDKFKTAQKAGLFAGVDVRGASRDVRRALDTGNDRRLFELARQDNPVINQLLEVAGRSDITGLVEADKELRLAKAVDDGNAAIVERLDQLIEQGIGGRIEQLIVQTPDPVADTSRIVSDVANMQTAGVNA